MVNIKHLWVLSLFVTPTLHAGNITQMDDSVMGAHLFGEEGTDAINDTDSGDGELVILDEAVELELAEIRLILEQKKYEEGLKRLGKLTKDNPNNIELIKMKAYAESASGHWSKAIETLDAAEKIFPGNEDLKGVRDDILDSQRDNRDFLSLEGEFRKAGSTRKEYFGFLKGRVRVASFTFIGIEGDHDTIYAKEITHPKNGSEITERHHRQKGNVYVEQLFGAGHSVKAGIYGAAKTIGGHAGLTLADAWGSTTLEGKLRRPDWDYSETVIFNGTRDTVSLMRILKFTDSFKIEGEGGFNNYNIDSLNNIAESFHALARASYTFYEKLGFGFLPGTDTGITFSYFFDAEYPYCRKNRVGGPDGGYPILAIERAENHGVEVYISTFLTKDLEAVVYGGYSISRFARNIPFAGAHLDYTIMKKVQLGLEYEHTVDGANRGDAVDRVRVRVKYLFN